MRKLFTLVATLAIMLGLPAAVAAQDTEYTVVGSLEIAPEYTEAFLAQVKIVRDAALEVGIDERFQWQLYRWDDELLFVSPGQSPTDVFDEAGMVQAFQGTSAESRVMAAFQKVSSFNVGAQSQSVLRPRPSLGYEPANLAPAVAVGSLDATLPSTSLRRRRNTGLCLSRD